MSTASRFGRLAVTALAGFPAVCFAASNCLNWRDSVFRVSNCRHGQSGTAFLARIVDAATADGEVVFLTALHNVRHCNAGEWATLRNESGVRTMAALYKVDVHRDLAVLRLAQPLSARPIPWSVRPAAEHLVLGYSHGSDTVHDLSVRLQRHGEAVELRSHFGGYWDKAPDYPDPKTPVYALDGFLQPGDSGAPLLDAACGVRAIVVGGWLQTATAGAGIRRTGTGASYAIPVTPAHAFTDAAPANPELLAFRRAQFVHTGLAPDGRVMIDIFAADSPAPPHAAVHRLTMMQSEVSYRDLLGHCRSKEEWPCAEAIRPRAGEEDTPAAGLRPESAERVCGLLIPRGRLPTWSEWKQAASLVAGASSCSYHLNQLPCAGASRTFANRLRPVFPVREDDYGFADLFGNAFEMVRHEDGYALAGGSFRTKPGNLWAAAQAATVGQIAGGPTIFASASRSEIGFRCVVEE